MIERGYDFTEWLSVLNAYRAMRGRLEAAETAEEAYEVCKDHLIKGLSDTLYTSLEGFLAQMEYTGRNGFYLLVQKPEKPIENIDEHGNKYVHVQYAWGGEILYKKLKRK